MQALGLILMTLLVHVHSQCGSQPFVHIEIGSQLENITAPNTRSQLETLLQNQAAMIV